MNVGQGVFVWGQPGGSATVDNASVNAAIEEDATATLSSLGLTEIATQHTVQLEVVAPGTPVGTGDSQVVFVIPALLNGANLIGVVTYSTTAGTTGTQDVQIHRVRAGTPADVLSTKCTQDSTEKSSTTAATAAVINTSNDDVSTDDEYHVDVDAVQTTPAEGLFVTFVFEVPLT